jgi:RNA polymerase sigma-70 factor (ECF subfamily)
MTFPEKTDEAIAAALQAGDIEAFTLLLERYEQKILRYGRRFLFDFREVEDVVQEVFLKAYQNIQSFDATRKFSSWLYRIAHNEFVNVLRKKGRSPISFFDPETIFPHPQSKEIPEKDFLDQETKAVLDKALEILPAKYQEPLILHYIEDIDYREIADILHLPVSTVGVRILRAKKLLREHLLKTEKKV